MKIVIFGSGGVGGYFGGQLARAGEDVTFVARGTHLQAMLETGLRVHSDLGNFTIKPVQATDDTETIGEVDVVFLAVKGWQVRESIQALSPLIGEQTMIVPLLNGVEAPGQLVDAFGTTHVLGGFCRVLSHIAEPGLISQSGLHPSVTFGELDNRRSERVEKLRAILENAGINVTVPDDIQSAMWQKFVFIATISGVGAVTRLPAGIIRRLPQTRAMLRQAAEEVTAVGRAHGISLPETMIDDALAVIDRMPPDGLASMQRAILEGRPSELESQNGAVVRLAREVGVAVPLHEFIYASLLPQELTARGEIDFTLQGV
ncbi:MAG: 2-dehydropantoate 2-reductase [Chloroflexi bacterium]|nr:MAG: 2-dehydropantoate 2-reductase [Phototrophicales bacterium]RMF78816.1 MAG: 2-dehydropantoate 2-reductase [Chloroflexota bacterium]